MRDTNSCIVPEPSALSRTELLQGNLADKSSFWSGMIAIQPALHCTGIHYDEHNSACAYCVDTVFQDFWEGMIENFSGLVFIMCQFSFWYRRIYVSY